MWRCIPVFLAAQLLISLGSKQVVDEREAIKGRWKVALYKLDGKPGDEEIYKKRAFVISQKDIILVEMGSKGSRLTYKIDKSKKPMTIDLVNIETNEPMVGIIAIASDELKLCLTHGSFKRPTSFDYTNEVGPVVFLKLKRE